MIKKINTWDPMENKRGEEWIDGDSIYRIKPVEYKKSEELANIYYRALEISFGHGDVILHPVVQSRTYLQEVEALLTYFGLQEERYEGLIRKD